jgi:hypothetical protein
MVSSDAIDVLSSANFKVDERESLLGLGCLLDGLGWEWPGSLFLMDWPRERIVEEGRKTGGAQAGEEGEDIVFEVGVERWVLYCRGEVAGSRGGRL